MLVETTCCSQPSSHAFCPLDWGCVGSSCWLCSSESLTHFDTSVRANYKWLDLDLDSAVWPEHWHRLRDVYYTLTLQWHYLDGNSGSLSQIPGCLWMWIWQALLVKVRSYWHLASGSSKGDVRLYSRTLKMNDNEGPTACWADCILI